MTNDTNTLNGALQELGETMADNLTTMGVPSTYDEGLTTLAQKILSIGPTPPTPTPASIDLTGTKSILSYADSESSVLTATVLDENDDPVEGVDVNLYNGATLWDTLTTDSSGECSKTYTSAGSGDITFTAEVDGTLLTKTYDVQDCIKYDSTTYSSDHIYDLQLPSSQYTLEFDILKKTNATYSKGTGGVIIGGNPSSSSYFMIGSGSETNYYISRWGTGLTFTNLTLLTQNTWKSVKCEINGTSADIIIDGVTYSVTGISADTSKLYQANCNSDNLNVRNIKIKPL